MFFLMLGIAIAAFKIHSLLSDEISRILTGFIAQGCLVMSLVHAPWLIQLLVVIAIFMLFSRSQTRFLE